LEEYVCHVVDATVKSGIARQMEAFKSAFNEVFALQFCSSLLMLVTGGGFHLHYDCLVWLYSGNALILEHKKCHVSVLLLFGTLWKFRYYQKARL
jgi:Trk-type K+ transport system membrane component